MLRTALAQKWVLSGGKKVANEWNLTSKENRALAAVSVPTHTADSWVRAHPRPGPSLFVWFLNSQGAANAWDVLLKIESEAPHVVALREPSFILRKLSNSS